MKWNFRFVISRTTTYINFLIFIRYGYQSSIGFRSRPVTIIVPNFGARPVIMLCDNCVAHLLSMLASGYRDRCRRRVYRCHSWNFHPRRPFCHSIKPVRRSRKEWKGGQGGKAEPYPKPARLGTWSIFHNAFENSFSQHIMSFGKIIRYTNHCFVIYLSLNFIIFLLCRFVILF